MENVVSIFTGEAPCYNLSLTNDEFYNSVKSDNGTFIDHLIHCRECIIRHNLLVRYKLNDWLTNSFNSGE